MLRANLGQQKTDINYDGLWREVARLASEQRAKLRGLYVKNKQNKTVWAKLQDDIITEAPFTATPIGEMKKIDKKKLTKLQSHNIHDELKNLHNNLDSIVGKSFVDIKKKYSSIFEILDIYEELEDINYNNLKTIIEIPPNDRITKISDVTNVHLAEQSKHDIAINAIDKSTFDIKDIYNEINTLLRSGVVTKKNQDELNELRELKKKFKDQYALNDKIIAEIKSRNRLR